MRRCCNGRGSYNAISRERGPSLAAFLEKCSSSRVEAVFDEVGAELLRGVTTRLARHGVESTGFRSSRPRGFNGQSKFETKSKVKGTARGQGG